MNKNDNIKFMFKKLKQKYQLFLVRREINREFGEIFKLAKQVEILGEKIVNKINWDTEQINFYCVNLLAQNLHKLKSITILIKNGCSSDAWQVFRPLMESVLDYDYILRNPQKLELYFQYSSYLDIEKIKRIRIARTLTKEESDLLKEIEKEWGKYKHLFTHNGRTRISWRDKPLSEIAKDIKFETIYSLGYKNAHDYSHGNSNLIRYFVKGKNSKGLMLKAGPTFEKNEILSIFPSSLVLMFQMIMRANWYFKLGLDDEVKKLDKAIIKYCSNVII